MRTRPLVAVVLSAVIPCFVCVSRGSAAPVLDQRQENWNGSARIKENHRVAQTFVPSISGPLDSVAFHEYGPFKPTAYVMTVSIVETRNGVPDGPVLGSASVDPPGISHWLTLNFADQDVRLQAGRQYGIVMTSTDRSTEVYPYGDEMNVSWRGNPYARGALWRSVDGVSWTPLDFPGENPGDADLAFRTYMVPEPAGAVALLVAGAVVASGRRRALR